jgi:hypothetical protein
MARRKSNDPVATCVKERIGADGEGENLLTPDKIERCVDFAGAAGRQRAKLQAKRPRRRLGVRQLVRRSRPKSRIPKKAVPDYSGSPAIRRPSMYLARSSGR